MIAWHYTAGRTLPAILRSGVLHATALGSWGPRERPAVWFTLRRDWDPATGLGRKATPELVARFNAILQKDGSRAAVDDWKVAARIRVDDLGGLARIGVAPETAPYTWREYARASGIPPALAAVRAHLDRESGSDPDDWRVSFVPVPASSWLAVEWRSGIKGYRNKWEPYRPASRDEQIAEAP